MYPSCPHCGGMFIKEHDGDEFYLNCVGCAREFTFSSAHLTTSKMIPRRMTPPEFEERLKIKKKPKEELGGC